MADHDTITTFINRTQIAIFDDARSDLQLSNAEIARRAKLPVQTVAAWAQGRNTLTLWGLKKLLYVKELAPLLSRLFEPEEYALIALMAGVDYDGLAEHCGGYLRQHREATHPTSPGGREIVDSEAKGLNQCAAKLHSIGGGGL